MSDRSLRQVAVTDSDVKRWGRERAVKQAWAANRDRLERSLVKGRDGQLYVRTPLGQVIKTNGEARPMPDGTLQPIPPAPRPSKRERAKMKRNLKRKEKSQ